MNNRERHHETIESLADDVLQSLDGKRSALIYAPNTIGKTRLAQYLKDGDPDGVLLYNSFVEDVFTWDNKRVVLKIDQQSEIFQTIETQGLDRLIVENFESFTNGKIEPTIDTVRGEVNFGLHRGDDRSADRIKISRAEESIFVWSVYYSLLSDAIDTLDEDSDNRSTDDYDDLKLAVIDDPVSSMDDVRIVSVALAVADLIRRADGIDLKFLVTTHHALFFNVLFNSRGWGGKRNYILQRGAIAGWILKNQSQDSPFSYHLTIMDEIESAISENSVQRVHFNQFRAILEKTSAFFGYYKWSDLLTGPDAAILTQVLNLYSHDRFSDIESADIPEEHRVAFKGEFEEFCKRFGRGEHV